MNTKDIEILLGITEILESHTVYNAEDWKIYNALNAVFNDKWITVHPNGKDEKGQPLLVRDGETYKDAIDRKFGNNKKTYNNEIIKLQNKREELKKEFADADFTRKKEILEENSNILKQLYDLRTKEMTNRRESLLKNAGNYKKTLEQIVVKNENIVNSLAHVQQEIKEAEEKWIELGKQKYQLWDDFKKIEKSQNIPDKILKEKEAEYNKKVSEYFKQHEIVNDLRLNKFSNINKILKIESGANIHIQSNTKSKEVAKILNDSYGLLNGIVSNDIMPKEPIKAVSKKGKTSTTIKGRSDFNPETDILEIAKDNDVTDVVHEVMHWLEKKNEKVLNNSLTFLEYRTQGEKPQKLKDLTKINYKDNEISKPDKFFDAYCGKIYNVPATEIMSMGLQQIYNNPLEFAEKDREYMSFVISNLRGEV